MSMFSRRRALGALAALAAVRPGAAAVGMGDMAPDFNAPATNGQKVSLAQYRGKKNVVLAFFPKAFTGGCTAEMKAYQASLDKFTSTDTVVYGVSTDDLETNKKFAESLNLQFALLSDPSGELAKKYEVFNAERNIASRKTFVIDKTGKVVHTEEGREAVDMTGTATACSRLK
jgi:peroxiredoxin Q/BCP